MAIPDDFLDSAQARRLVEICEALATIQRHTFVPVRVPDFTTVTTETALEWIQVARLLRGEVLKRTWETMPVTLRPGIDFPAEEQEPLAVALPNPLTVTISETVIPLGEQIIHVSAARLDRDSFTIGPDGQRNMTLVPASDNTLTIQWKSANEKVLQMSSRRARSRLRSLAILSYEFVWSTWSYSVAAALRGQVHSAYIPDHGRPGPPTVCFSGRTYPQLARIVRELCAVAGRCCKRLAAAVAVTVAVSGWSWSHLRGLPGTVTAPCSAQTPPPNPIAAEPDGRGVLSRGGEADHEVTPQAPLTGSGCREHSYGGFGGGHPHFHAHAPDLLIRRSGQVVQDRPSPAVGWPDIPELSTCVGCRPVAWQQCWQQSRYCLR